MNKRSSICRIGLVAAIGLLAFQACKKEAKLQPDPPKKDTVATIISPVNDAAPVKTQGFFMDDWKPKLLTINGHTDAPIPIGDAESTVTIFAHDIVNKVSPYLFGNNVNTYMTQVVTEPLLMRHITNLSPKIIRAPGGSVTDLYFWNAQPGKVPADIPAQINVNSATVGVDSTLWYGKNTAAWTLSIDNYYQALLTTNNTGLIAVNYGYARYGTSAHPDQAAAHLAADWVRYDRGRTKYWEVGNENYGIWEAGYLIDTKKNKDGQPEALTGALYGKHFRVFADSMRKAAAEIGVKIKIGAVMTADDVVAGSTIANWNKEVAATAGDAIDFYTVHSYFTPYLESSSAETILNSAHTVSRAIPAYLLASTGTEKPIALGEWNIQAMGKNQAVSNISGLHAAMTLGAIASYKYGLACKWNLANNWANGDDMGMFNNGDEPGASKWNARPAFFYMYYFQKYFGDRMVSSTVSGNNDIKSYASSFSSGHTGTVLVNTGTKDHLVSINFQDFTPGKNYYYYVLNGGTESEFSRKVYINGIGPSGVSGGPTDYSTISPFSDIWGPGSIKVKVPAYGAVFLMAEGK
ncbi:alpha-L-arabinofuranosidase [Mucilaginibacter agri]|uniref:Alpha-L-arabinofuranosidase n=1 Tax=Mucilaginibacter agri TaxID=2695265 RepID=A0A965ZGC5_9SPHI|nr:alpha-L-arabinofuranosidase [Mucilaginibacter agri]NCD69567.1 alpha-L-arabinofuranosidase [Mucilaginibacter agri]